jgi:hypothetical protein
VIGKVGEGGASTSSPTCETWLICPLTELADEIMIRITSLPADHYRQLRPDPRRRAPWAILDLALVGWIQS